LCWNHENLLVSKFFQICSSSVSPTLASKKDYDEDGKVLKITIQQSFVGDKWFKALNIELHLSPIKEKLK